MTALIIILCLVGIAGVLSIKVFLDTLYPLFKKNNVEDKKEEATPAQKQKWQYNIPEFPPRLLGWLFIILIAFGGVYGITQIYSNISVDHKSTSGLVKTTTIEIKPFGTSPIILDRNLNHFRYTIPETKKTLIRFLRRNGEVIRFKCNGQQVTEYVSTGSNKVVSGFESYPYAIVFESAVAQNGSYSFEVKEYNE